MPRGGDGGEHVVVEVLAVHVGGDRAVPDGDRLRRGDRERLGPLAAPPVGVDQGEHQGQQQLETEHPQQRATQEATEPGGVGEKPGTTFAHRAQSSQWAHTRPARTVGAPT